MSVTRELLDRLKASNGGLSDYRVARMIGVTQPSMTKYNQNILSLSPEKVILICDLLGLKREEWLIKLQLERAKCTAEISVWDDLLHRIAA